MAVYSRISTDEHRQPFPLQAQQQRLRSYVDSQGWEPIGEPYAYQASGASLQWPALTRLHEQAKAGGVDGCWPEVLERRVAARLSLGLHDVSVAPAEG